MAKKILKGIIVSDKPDKTVVARVDRFVRHKRLEKVYRVSKKYFVHDPENKYRAGDKVAIEESRPFSKKKRWVIMETNLKIKNQNGKSVRPGHPGG